MRLIPTLCLIGVTLVPVSGMAQGNTDNEAAALEAFKEAKALYADSKFSEAANKFREANKLRPAWKLYFNIGQSEAAAKRSGLAVEAFEMYLSMGGDDVPVDRQELVVAEIKRLRPIVGFVSVTADPGATVIIDGNDRGTTPLPGPLMVAAGTEHDVRIERDGEALLERKVKVAGQQTISMEVEDEAKGDDEPLPEGPEVTAPDPEPEPIPQPKKSTRRSLGIAGLGVGAALLVSGAVTGGVALAQFSDLKDKCPGNQCLSTKDEDQASRADTLALVTDILLPVGAVVGTVGIILLVTSRRNRETESDAPVALRPVPVIGPERGGLFLEGRF